jgi:hypothetical protein
MSIEKELKKLESQYYRMFYEISFNFHAKKWMGKVRIVRKDTDEIVRGGFRVFDEKRHLLKNKMIKKIHSKLQADLKKSGIPYEWKSKKRLVLLSCLDLMDDIVEFSKFCHDTIVSKEDSQNFTGKYGKFWYELIGNTIAITKSIEQLTPQERIEILISPDFVYENPIDPWNFDDLDLRTKIFRFFLHPSEMEIKTYQEQSAKKIKLWDNFDTE